MTKKGLKKFKRSQVVLARDGYGYWTRAIIIRIKNDYVRVKFFNWDNSFNEWVKKCNIYILQPKAAKKTFISILKTQPTFTTTTEDQMYDMRHNLRSLTT